METKIEKNGKVLSGKIVSIKMKDTVVVSVERYTKHPKYGKFLKRQKKFKVHDAGNKHQLGEMVEIIETKPISKDKRFVILPARQNRSGGEK
ncbi:MAG: 30S ribosomal protein S17 [Candidatus Taylorbacteria bacterium RIFOXYD2_FULL_36_9]|uniref:Small ribosomal subunit protein uS17 n=1 Tax=Candidatus Taylorbacteria bacterium RIFOXYD2_FULL_36_9 TaxID=1802338 RepID=A0A1G2PIF1_9BACT|nr:MAG: 30S ribosomal protein S17 [Candidatus Taylorbacteria bacterium RIFOXYD2_FULL_36_9]